MRVRSAMKKMEFVPMLSVLVISTLLSTIFIKRYQF